MLLSQAGECLDPLLCVSQLLADFLNIKLAALSVVARPCAEIQPLLCTQGPVGIRAQLKTAATQGATLITLLIDQVTKVQLAVPMTAVNLGPNLFGGVVHHPLVVPTPLDFLASIAAHQTTGVPGGLMSSVDLAHHQGSVDVIVEKGDHDLLPRARHVHTAPALTTAGLHHAQPA
ncbi:hypothetical protein D3C85_1422390 [compost metagenome]